MGRNKVPKRLDLVVSSECRCTAMDELFLVAIRNAEIFIAG